MLRAERQKRKEKQSQKEPIAFKTSKSIKVFRDILFLMVAAVAVLIIVGINANSTPTIDLNKYISFSAVGYDGYGNIVVNIDWDSIQKKYEKKIKSKSDYFSSALSGLETCIRVNCDADSNLSNGDKVNYTWQIDDYLYRHLKVKLKYNNGAYTVSGLEKLDTFDAFKNLSVQYTGIAPDGELEMDYDGSEFDTYDFDSDYSYGLSNGDKIMITISDDAVAHCAQDYGKVPETQEKTYTVEGLTSYVKNLKDIDGDALEAMKTQAADVFNAYVAQDWESGLEGLEDFTYLGDYLLTAKSSDDWSYSGINNLYLVYKFSSHITYSSDLGSYDQVKDGYWYIRYSNLIADDDGTVHVDVTDYSTPDDRFSIDTGVSNGLFGTVSYYYYGYATFDAFYSNEIVANKDDYNVEENISEET